MLLVETWNEFHFGLCVYFIHPLRVLKHVTKVKVVRREQNESSGGMDWRLAL